MIRLNSIHTHDQTNIDGNVKKQLICDYIAVICFIVFFFLSIKVNTNGYISFGTGSYNYTIRLSSSSIPVLSPFAADVNTNISGTISYKVITQYDDNDSYLLDTMSSLIR